MTNVMHLTGAHNKLPHISKVERLSEKDIDCLREIRVVLARHNALRRFGVTLLHKHFEVMNDEVLLETCDEDKRLLTTKVVKKSELSPESAIETNWELDLGIALHECRLYCWDSGLYGHQSRHEDPQ